MTDNYEKIVQENLARLYSDLPDDLASRLLGEQEGESFRFKAFGDTCHISPEKIRLCYIFYEADADFPASVTCLYSRNAHQFIPIDGLADVGEYTSRKILDLI